MSGSRMESGGMMRSVVAQMSHVIVLARVDPRAGLRLDQLLQSTITLLSNTIPPPLRLLVHH